MAGSAISAIRHRLQVLSRSEGAYRTQVLIMVVSARRAIAALRAINGSSRLLLAEVPGETFLASRLTTFVLVRSHIAGARSGASQRTVRSRRTRQCQAQTSWVRGAGRTEVAGRTLVGRMHGTRQRTVVAGCARRTVLNHLQTSRCRVGSRRTLSRRYASCRTVVTCGTDIVALSRVTRCCHVASYGAVVACLA